MKINKKLVICGVACALVLISGTVLLLPKNVNAEPARRREYTAEKGSIIVGIDAGSTVSSKKQNQFVDTPLLIDEYKVNVGDFVKKGDVIANLSKEDIEQKKRIAQDKLLTEQAALDKLVADKQNQQQETDKNVNDIRTAAEKAYQEKASIFTTKRAMELDKISVANNSIANYNDAIKSLENEKAARGGKIAALDNEIVALQAKIAELQKQIADLISDTANDNTEKILELTQQKLDGEMSVADKTREKQRIETTDYDSEIAKAKAEILVCNAAIKKANGEIVAANKSLGEIEAQRTEEKKRENASAEQIAKQAKAQSKIIDSQISTAKTAVDTAKAQLDLIKKYVQDAVITAEYEGVITKLGFTANAVTDKATPFVEIGSDDEKTLILQVDPSDVTGIEAGQEVSFYVDAYEDETFTGTVKSKSYLQNSNGKFEVTVTFKQEETKLLDGMGANATLIIKQKLDILTLSNKAIFLENNKSYVNIQDEKGILQKKQIKTGFSNGRITEVIEGLAEGDIALMEEKHEN